MDEQSSIPALRRSAQDPGAFVGFYEAHFEQVLAFMLRRVYDAEIALDLAAETFAQAYLGRQRFRGSTDRQAAAWLYRIARRQVGRYFKQGKAEREAITRLGIETPALDEAQQAAIEEFAELATLRETVGRELRRLAPPNREALRLRIVDELPYREVANRLDISEQAARARVSRALKSLALALDRNPETKESFT